MSAGNRIGDGIYFATDFNYSASFSTGCMEYSDRWNNGMYKEGFRVVSICEIISTATIKEGSEEFVVPREQDGNVGVRYLIVDVDGIEDIAPSATICDGHILSHGGITVDLSDHYQSIKQKYGYSFGSK